MREAVANAPPDSPREPLARDLARQVVDALAAYLAEPDNPLLAAFGEVERKAYPSPAVTLATDPEVDTLALFIEARVEALRNRYGCGLSPADDIRERQVIMADVEARLAGRYLRHLRWCWKSGQKAKLSRT